MPTDTFPIAADADDGAGYYFHTAWPPSGGTFAAEDGIALLVAAKEESDFYYAEVVLLRWDTSSIPDTATITGANLKLYLVSKVTTLTRNLVGDYYDFGGSPTVAADWILTPSPSIFTAVDVATGLTTGAVNTIALTDLTGINVSGYTGVRLAIDGGDTGVEVQSKARFASREDTTNQEPRLEVTYTLATTPQGLPQFEAIPFMSNLRI